MRRTDPAFGSGTGNHVSGRGGTRCGTDDNALSSIYSITYLTTQHFRPSFSLFRVHFSKTKLIFDLRPLYRDKLN